ncbi:hypothetical protein B0A55_08434 [Friedmanniomyces simplex]|uniref:Uncharacterized protein n=1 Tax=Friedmanniomyces simplex TaxID=329884 RepID=A0A4U0WVP4_9PEZI|nr:hypothetical protein B0A55_08434 [Friedmanniomyces simplex]
MKDSDDYLTARAANPWTGLISPSIGGSPSPRTPETPAAASSSSRQNPTPPISPTPASSSTAQPRPALSRANEGRKVSAGSLHRWRAGVGGKKGWQVSEAALASPREKDATAGASAWVKASSSCLGDDRFVVPMPSAREPQPYVYPGCSAAEIQAFEHYKREARKVSREEYGGGRASSSYVHAGASGGRKMAEIRVAKRQAHGGGRGGHHEPALLPAPELTAATFAPFASPHTPSMRAPDVEATMMRTVRAPGTYRDISPHPDPETGPIRRKPVCSPQPTNNLTQLLPRVRLVHPELASLPRPPPPPTTCSRTCSLGCSREAGGSSECHEQTLRPNPHPTTSQPEIFFNRPIQTPPTSPRKAHVAAAAAAANNPTTAAKTATATVTLPLPPPQDQDQDPTTQLLATLLTYAVHKSQPLLHFPNPTALSALRIASATPQEKLDALRSLLRLGAQGLAILMVLSALWRLGAAVAGVVEMVVWPLVVPCRIVRWMVGGVG